MEQESIVYGCIKDMSFGNEAQRRSINRDAMLTLPPAEDWGLLSRDMFSAPKGETPVGYLTEVLHFGASYKAVEYEWEQWISQFEQLLAKMFWVSAVVHLETELSGNHCFVWESTRNYHEPYSGNMQVRCEWVHETNFSL